MSKPRPIAGGTLKLRELEIAVKLFAAARPHALSFNLLHAKDKSRIQQKIYCPVDDAIIDRSELVRGYQVEKGVYVTFTDEELANLEDELIEITAFVPIASVDPVYFDASYHVGCELTSADAYRSLAVAMGESGSAALATFTLNGKEHLALIRTIESPIADGELLSRLMLHTLFFAAEVNSANDIDEARRGNASRETVDLTKELIDEMGSEFDPGKYVDRYRDRVIAAAQAKLAGETPAGKKDGALVEQLRASIKTHSHPSCKRAGSARKSKASTKRSESARA